MDYYSLLEVKDDASADEIKTAYRTMMFHKRYHPDLGGDQQLAKELNGAYETLMTPERRAAYDEEIRKNNSHSESSISSIGDTIQRCPKCSALNFIETPLSDDHHCILCGYTMMTVDRGEMRHKTRYAFNELVKLSLSFDKPPKDGKAIDLSDSGLRAISFEKTSPGQTLYVFANEFQAQGKLVWMKERKQLFRPVYEIGVKFDKFHSWERKFLFSSVA